MAGAPGRTAADHIVSLLQDKTTTLREHTIWVLVGCFMLQPLLTYLATPMQLEGRDGLHTLVCTLEGSRDVVIDLPSINGEQEAADECPALKLLQIASSAQISLPQLSPPLSLYAIGVLDQTAHQPHHKLHFSAYSSRAPPLA